jgi:hypothetical protein
LFSLLSFALGGGRYADTQSPRPPTPFLLIIGQQKMTIIEIKAGTQKLADDLTRIANTIAHCKLDDYDISDKALLHRLILHES